MNCPKCGSSSWRITNYNSYRDELVYECISCGEVFISRSTISANESIEVNKQCDNYSSPINTIPATSNMTVGRNILPAKVSK